MEFEWDTAKEAENLKIGRLSFEKAALIFLDPHRLTIQDTRTDYGEERFITLGEIESRVHVVVYCERRGNIIRIISARKANRREQKRYENHQIHT